jgi:hypothetical protein
MRSYMLGERFLRRPGLIVSIVDNDPSASEYPLQ